MKSMLTMTKMQMMMLVASKQFKVNLVFIIIRLFLDDYDDDFEVHAGNRGVNVGTTLTNHVNYVPTTTYVSPASNYLNSLGPSYDIIFCSKTFSNSYLCCTNKSITRSSTTYLFYRYAFTHHQSNNPLNRSLTCLFRVFRKLKYILQ